MKPEITERDYLDALRCPKLLWLNQCKKEAAAAQSTDGSAMTFQSEVRALAEQLFPGCVRVPPESLSERIRETEILPNRSTQVLGNASFRLEQLCCTADYLKTDGRTIELYGVRSSLSVHASHLDVLAYQTFVLRKCGYSVKKITLVHLNRSYVREDALDLSQLFVFEDVTKPVLSRQKKTEGNIQQLRSILTQDSEPVQDLSEACRTGIVCPYFSRCTHMLEQPNVFSLRHTQQRTIFEYYRKGIITYAQLLEDGSLNRHARMQVEYELCDKEPHIEAEPILAFLNGLQRPISFLDFEAFQPPLPLYAHSSPYAQIPFQYSLHIQKHRNAPAEHREFLADPDEDPRRPLAERLIQDIPSYGTVLAWNMEFERSRIRELESLFPDLARELEQIRNRIRDLIVPFEKKWYYCREMNGSGSIKSVLPALFPDHPDLNYENLEAIHAGQEAAAAFLHMKEMNPETRAKTQKELLDYCGLDTRAMVLILNRLYEITGQ